MADTRAIVSDPSGTFFVVDLTAQTTLATFVVATPGQIAVLPNATQAYVTNNGGVPGHLYPVNLPAYTLGATITVGNQPNQVVASPNGTHVYTTSGSTNVITPVATPSNVAGAGITLAGTSNVQWSAIDPASANLYATTLFNGIYPIAIPANTVGASWATTLQWAGIVVLPDGIHGYASNGTNVYPINVVAQTVGAPIATTTTTSILFLKPDGTEVWAPSTTTNTVMVISTASNTQTHNITLTGGGVSVSGGFDSAGTTFYAPNPSTGNIYSINTGTYALGPTWAFGGAPRYIAVVPTPAPPPTPPYPGGQFIPKLFIPDKGKVSVDYTPDELRANWMAIEIWSQRWLPPPTTALLFPHKNDPTPEGVNANWITLEVWGQVIKNLGAPYTPLFVPRKPSVKPEDLDIAFLAVQNWANRLPL